MGFFAKFAPNKVNQSRVSYSGSNPYVREIVGISDEFLKFAGKSRPTPEERFNAIFSFTAIILGYSCMKFNTIFGGLKNFDGGVVLSEVRTLLAELMVNPAGLSQNELERDALQTNLNSKFPKASHYPGDAVANILFKSRFEQFVNDLQHVDFFNFPDFARDYALLMIKAYTQEPNALMLLYFIVNSYLTTVHSQ